MASRGQPGRRRLRREAVPRRGRLRGRTHRFVNNNDIVPQLPPEPAFTHVPELRRFDAAGPIQEDTGLVAALAGRAKGLGEASFAPPGEGIRDHLMRNYLAALEKNLD
ncbi:hypothetical protein [Kitasatospora sp. NPDC085464]|uniref:hypothetical protein n=1 Tax=Kitasatospora sp. NPDC085464 TaxID=3364063 RepID=UPI0037C932E3